MKKTSYIPIILILMTFLYSLTHLSLINQITRSVYIDVFNLFSSIFVWMIFFAIANNYHFFNILGKLLSPLLSPLLKLNSIELALYISSIFSGYPTNVKIIKESVLSKERQIHLLKFASHPSLGFVVYMLGNHLFDNIVMGYCLFIIQIISSFLLAILFRKEDFHCTNQTLNTKPLIPLLKQEFKSCFIVFIYIFGFMLVSRIIVQMIPIKHILITGILEFSTGCLALSNYPPNISFPLCSFFLSFSSMSVILQSISIFDDSDYFITFLYYRLLQGMISLLISFTFTLFIF